MSSAYTSPSLFYIGLLPLEELFHIHSLPTYLPILELYRGRHMMSFMPVMVLSWDSLKTELGNRAYPLVQALNTKLRAESTHFFCHVETCV